MAWNIQHGIEHDMEHDMEHGMERGMEHGRALFETVDPLHWTLWHVHCTEFFVITVWKTAEHNMIYKTVGDVISMT